MAMQALVIAHAAYGHNSFFKGNYLFRMWTDAASIIDYLVYAKNYVADCEERHGLDAVESLPRQLPRADEPRRRPLPPPQPQERWRRNWPTARTARPTRSARSTTCGARCRASAEKAEEAAEAQALPRRAAGEPAVLHREERAAARALAARGRAHRAQGGAVLLPAAPDAGHERRLGHLLAPQAAEHDVRRRLPDRRRDDRVAEVAHQRRSTSRRSATGPTAASTRMRWALRCTPTSSASASSPPTKTAQWFPDIAGTPWLPVLDHAMRNFKDESFIGQYLSPKLMRDLRLFAIVDDEKQNELEVAAIHDDSRLPPRARSAVAPVRPGLARAQHPGLERQPARRPLD